jgi:hypothetical protein
MLVHHEARLDIPLGTAVARLANLVRGSRLISASADAYGEGITGLLRVGPAGGTPGLSREVQARFRDLITHGDMAVLTLRWEAAGPGGGLFPVLDADITLTAAGPQATMLAMDAAYRPPLGALGAGLDRAILHRVATATIESFVRRVADAVGSPAPLSHQAWERELSRPAAEAGDG